jgi:hypothetical protein
MAEKQAKRRHAVVAKAPPEKNGSDGFLRSAIGGVSVLYAAVAKFLVGGVEDLSDRRAERRAESVSQKVAKPNRAKSRRAHSPKAS